MKQTILIIIFSLFLASLSAQTFKGVEVIRTSSDSAGMKLTNSSTGSSARSGVYMKAGNKKGSFLLQTSGRLNLTADTIRAAGVFQINSYCFPATIGQSGYILKSNGSSLYWTPDTTGGGGGSSYVVRAPLQLSYDTIFMPMCDGSQSGYLHEDDYLSFAGKQNALRVTGRIRLSGDSLYYSQIGNLSVVYSNDSIRLLNDAAAPGVNKYYGTNSSGVKGFNSLPTYKAGSGLTLATDTFKFAPKTNSVTFVNDTVKLVNDVISPGVNKYYGTNPANVKGYYSLPTYKAGSGLTLATDTFKFAPKTNSVTFVNDTVKLVNDLQNPGNNKFYGTNAGGVKGWQTYTSSAAGGTTGNIQVNDGGLFYGEDNLWWDKTNSRLGINTKTPAQAVDVIGNVGVNGYVYSLRRFGFISCADANTGQAFSTGAGFVKLTAFRDSLSNGTTASAANDEITTAKVGFYEITFSASWTSNVANIENTFAIYVNNSVTNLKCMNKTGNTSNSVSSVITGIVKIEGNYKIDVRFSHNHSSTYTLTINNAQLSVKYLGEY